MTATGLSNNYYLDNEFKKWFVLDVIHNFEDGFKKKVVNLEVTPQGFTRKNKTLLGHHCVLGWLMDRSKPLGFWHSLSNLMDLDAIKQFWLSPSFTQFWNYPGVYLPKPTFCQALCPVSIFVSVIWHWFCPDKRILPILFLWLYIRRQRLSLYDLSTLCP